MADIIRVSLHGTMPAGEVWSINPVFKITTGAVITSFECQAAAVAIAAVAIPSGLRSFMGSQTAMVGARVEARTHAGGLEAQGEALKAVPELGSSTANNPFQSALVISLQTAAGGAHGRGRLYWPALSPGLDATTLRVPSANVTSFLASAKSYLTSVQNALDGAIDETVGLAVWSRTSESSSLVVKLKAGDVIDTQRRRRDTVPETYAELNYIP